MNRSTGAAERARVNGACGSGETSLLASDGEGATQREEELLTEELLERLLASASIEAYLDEGQTRDRDLPDYLHGLLEEHGITRASVARSSGLNATVVYDIFCGKSRPGRDHAIMLAFGLGCDVREAQRLLRIAGVSELYCKVRRDAILIWCFDHGLDRAAADDELWCFGEKTLLGTSPLRVGGKGLTRKA